MIQFPGSSKVGRIMPKEAFYKRLNLSTELKEKFISDIRRISVENSLTDNTLNLQPGKEVAEILVLGLELKQQTIDKRILENIARQNEHKILFCLSFEDAGQLALYETKLYKTEWMPADVLQLETKGFTLDEVWENFIKQIALTREAEGPIKEAPLAYRLKRQEDILKLEKKIEQLEKAAWTEKQPKKKFELAMLVQRLRQELDEL